MGPALLHLIKFKSEIMLVVCRDVTIVVTTDISHMKPRGMYVVIFYVTEITFTM